MDGGPFRAQRPADRKVTSRPEPTYRRPDEPQPVSDAPKAMPRASASPRVVTEEKSMKRFILPIVAVIVVIILGIAGWFAWTNMQNTATAIDESKYQAVLLTNGESYFGKLTSLNNDFMKLTDVYYLKVQATGEAESETSQQQTTDESSFQLIKFGGEVQGPEDEILISKEQIVYYENLKPDGKASQAIEQHKQSN